MSPQKCKNASTNISFSFRLYDQHFVGESQPGQLLLSAFHPGKMHFCAIAVVVDVAVVVAVVVVVVVSVVVVVVILVCHQQRNLGVRIRFYAIKKMLEGQDEKDAQNIFLCLSVDHCFVLSHGCDEMNLIDLNLRKILN